MPVEFRQYITRKMIRSETDMLFVFGDNMVERGFGGQAAEMRGEINTVGLPTKWYPSNKVDAYFSDADLQKVIAKVDPLWTRLLNQVLFNGTVVWPADGIGSGRAQLKRRAPEIARFYDRLLKSLSDAK